MTDVEPEYTGARIEGDVVTLDFVKKMMDDFKNQKCLHKRYILKGQEFLFPFVLFISIEYWLCDCSFYVFYISLESWAFYLVDMHFRLFCK